MKRSVLIIYIIMIIVGVIGLFFYVNQFRISEAPPERTPQKTISAAVARRDLDAYTVLKPEDFQIKNISVPIGSTDVQFNIADTNLINWALRNPVSTDTYIHPSNLAEPGSDDYLTMFLQPENVLYTFTLETSDNYLLTNIKPGQGVDIFLSYSLREGVDGTDEIVSPAHSIRESRLKPLMVNKRVLAMRPAKMVVQNGVEVAEKGSQLIVELQGNEVKMLKGLEGKTKILLFPATQAKGESNTELPREETSWPVNDDVIFRESQRTPKAITAAEVNELRG